MQSLKTGEVFMLGVICEVARRARQYDLANVVFARLLVEAAAHHSDWEVLWLTDKNNPYYDLIALNPLSVDTVD